MSFTRAQLTPYLGEGYIWDNENAELGEGGELVYAGGLMAVCFYDENSPYGNFWRYDCFLNPDTGEISGQAPAGFDPQNGWGDWDDETPAFADYDAAYPLTDLVTGDRYYWGKRGEETDLLDGAGNPLLRNRKALSGEDPLVADGMLGDVADDVFRYERILTGETAFRYDL